MIIRHGDCIAEMSALLDEGVRVDAVVTDPPYELGFMGKGWDSTGIANRVETWLLALELLKPGGHLLAFSGTRTQHRMVCAIEDAGFEIRDQIGWLYGTGFPKSLDVSKAIDKAAGAEREVVGSNPNHRAVSGVGYEGVYAGGNTGSSVITAPATDAAREWQGWGTALKPANEPICVARKPLEGTVAANVLAHGTGALNIDASRVPTTDSLGGGRLNGPTDMSGTCGGPEWDRPWMHDDARRGEYAERTAGKVAKAEALGRWPANVIHDGSDEVLEAFAAFGESGSSYRQNKGCGMGYHGGTGPDRLNAGHNDTGTAARFFKACEPSEEEALNSTLVWLLWQSNVDIIIGDSNGADACLSETAPHAGPHSPLSHQTTGGIAQSDATGLVSGKSGLSANSVASPSGSCGTPTVQSPARARIRTGSDLRGLFTNDTVSDLKKLGETLIAVIQSIESACSHGSLPTKLSLTLSHAKCAAIREQTGITTITISHWKSNGSAEPVTFSITPKNSAPGAKGSASASRFTYSAKASKADRAGSKHPTVKPISLMRYLCRLVTPPGGLILDPFAGSGTTLEAAALEGFRCIGIEQSAEYVADIRRRLERTRADLGLFAAE